MKLFLLVVLATLAYSNGFRMLYENDNEYPDSDLVSSDEDDMMMMEEGSDVEELVAANELDQKGKRMPASLRFGKRMPNSLRFGKRMPASLRFGKRMPASLRFGKRMPASLRFGKRMPNSLRFGKRMPNSLRFGRSQGGVMSMEPLDVVEVNEMPEEGFWPSNLRVAKSEPEAKEEAAVAPKSEEQHKH